MKAGMIHLNAKIDELETLLSDIASHDFTTTHQIIGLIQSNLDSLNAIKLKESASE